MLSHLLRTTCLGVCLSAAFACSKSAHKDARTPGNAPGNGGTVAKHSEADETLSYSFEDSTGCVTKQSFTSEAAYCAGLTDEALNKGCALKLRVAAYKAKSCLPKLTDNAGDDSTPSSGTSHTSNSTTHTTTTPAATTVPTTVNVSLKLDSSAQAIETPSGAAFISVFQSRLASPSLDSAAVAWSNIDLLHASSVTVVTPNPAGCEPEIQLTDTLLMVTGIDKNVAESSACSLLLRSMEWNGLTLELKDVPLLNSTGHPTIGKVTLTLSK